MSDTRSDLDSFAADTCRAGDPDPTESNHGPFCDDRSCWSGYRCTRKPDHGGQHVAGTGDCAVAVWDSQYLTVYLGEQ